MNERIQELVEQVWQEVLSETSIEGDIGTMFSADEVIAFETKFAHLIIKECADICLRQSRSGWNDDRKAQARLDYNLINEHFGVEP